MDIRSMRDLTLEIAVIEWRDARKAWLAGGLDAEARVTPEWDRLNRAEIRLYELASALPSTGQR